MQLIALFRLAFATAPCLRHLTLLHTITHRLIMQKARRQSEDLRLLVGTWFQVLFHSPPGVLFTFPSRYWCTIGRRRIFSLRRWSSRIPTEFHVLRGTWEYYKEGIFFLSTGLSPTMVSLSREIRLKICFVTSRLIGTTAI